MLAPYPRNELAPRDPVRVCISRVHGRPMETVENVTAFDDPLDVSKMTREERNRLKRQLIAQDPDAARALGLVREDAAA